MHRALATALLILTFPALSAFAAQEPSPVASPASAGGESDIAGLFDIGGGRHLYLECIGSGGPTVILEAGYRSPIDVWTTDLVSPDAPRIMVFEGVAARTRTCVYERPGVVGRQPLAGVPLAVISAGLPFGIPQADLVFSPDRLQEAWSASQNRLAALIPGSPHIVATESAHYVQLQQPDLVIDAVIDVLGKT